MDDTDRPETPREFNVWALAGLILFGAIAFVGLFAFPALQSMGFSGAETFWIVSAVEFFSAVGAGISGYYLYTERDIDPGIGD